MLTIKQFFSEKCLLLLLQTALIHVLRRMRLQCDAFWAVTQSQYFINPSQPHVTTLDVSCGCHRQLMHTASCALNLLHRGRQQWGKSRKRGKRKKWVKLNSKQLMSEPCARCQYLQSVVVRQQRQVIRIRRSGVPSIISPVKFCGFPVPDTKLPIGITRNKVTIATTKQKWRHIQLKQLETNGKKTTRVDCAGTEISWTWGNEKLTFRLERNSTDKRSLQPKKEK